MLKLATLIQNPGEPPVDSRYADPRELAELGYTGQVLYSTTALSGVASPDVVQDGELRRWVQHHVDHVQQRMENAAAAGLEVYIFYDVLVLAADLVERYAGQVCCKNRTPGSLTPGGSGVAETTSGGSGGGGLCPASDQALELSVDALTSLLQRWPGVTGVVLRFGDNDAARLPHLVGNDIYTPHCPRCSRIGRAERILRIAELFYDRVVKQLDRKLIIRAWNLRPNGLHDAPELARRVVEQLPGAGDDRLMLSFKFTQTDFWRYQRWNQASLQCGQRPVIYELQCQREFEGKGAVPNYQAPLWRDGQPEMADVDAVHGLAEASDKINLAGLWAWVRGGGWGGPFIRHEQWIDANVFAAPRLADDPKLNVSQLTADWIRERLGVSDRKIAAGIERILLDSTQFTRDMFYIGPFARTRTSDWHPNGDWVQDDVIDVEAAWRLVQRVPDRELPQIVAEKTRAAQQISQHRAALQQLVKDRNHPSLEPLLDAMVYAESLVEMLRDLMAGLVAYRMWQRTRSASDAMQVRQKLFAAQSHWNHHAQRHGALPGAASSFREVGFWDVTQRMLEAVM